MQFPLDRPARIRGVVIPPVLAIPLEMVNGRGGASRVVVDVPPDLVQRADDQDVGVFVLDVVIDDLLLHGADVAGRIVMRATLARLPREASDGTRAAGLPDAHAPILVVHQCGPVLGRSVTHPRPAAFLLLLLGFLDATEFVPGEGLVACVAHRAI